MNCKTLAQPTELKPRRSLEEINAELAQIQRRLDILNGKPVPQEKIAPQKIDWWVIPIAAVFIPIGFVGLTVWMVYRIIRVQVVERLIDLIPRRKK